MAVCRLRGGVPPSFTAVCRLRGGLPPSFVATCRLRSWRFAAFVAFRSGGLLPLWQLGGQPPGLQAGTASTVRPRGDVVPFGVRALVPRDVPPAVFRGIWAGSRTRASVSGVSHHRRPAAAHGAVLVGHTWGQRLWRGCSSASFGGAYYRRRRCPRPRGLVGCGCFDLVLGPRRRCCRR